MITYKFKKATTDVSVVIRIIDSTDGTPETGVVWNTAGIDLWYRREGAVSVDITEATLAALTTAHTDGGFLHINDGYYRLDLPDLACATGANGVLVGGIVTGMVVIGCYIQLVDYDPFDTVRLGLTALPNAAADAAGGLPISDAGALDLDLYLKSGVSLIGTASVGDTTVKITLNGGVGTANYYNGQLVIITGGTGAGQARTILKYLANNEATPTRDFVVAPDNTSTFVVIGADVPSILEAGVATAATASNITLDATAPTTVDIFKNNFIMISGGTGAGQTRLIGAYSAGRVATILPNWTTTPDTTSIYQILPMARVDIQGWLGNVITGDGDWAALKADTAEIGAAGAGLTDLGGMSTGMKAEVESEVNDALVALKLDHLVAVAESDDPVDDSIIAKMAASDGDWSGFTMGQDSLEGIYDKVDNATVTVLNDTSNIKSRLPTTLISGLMNSHITLISGGAITHESINTDLDTYQGKIVVIDADAQGYDRYQINWFKNGEGIEVGITNPTIQVYDHETGNDLITITAMTEVDGRGTFRYVASGVERIIAGSGYVTRCQATIDGFTRTWSQPIGRDS